jgi:hypothetical protein
MFRFSLTTTFLFLSIFSPSQTPTLVNYPLVKGYYLAAVKDGTTLYCLADYGAMAWDVSDLNAPVLLSKTAVPGINTGGELIEYGDYLFVQRHDVIHVVDKSNPAAMTAVSTNLSATSANDIA